jgi:REP element-mobilizing transposase RayT
MVFIIIRGMEIPILPQRKRLPHEIPPWVGQGARHFITINALRRTNAPFGSVEIASALLRNLLAYEDLDRWHLWLAVVMPDHLHFIVTFTLEQGVAASVSAWKGYQAKTLKLEFQSGFFEHRLRDEAEFAEKAMYIRENPVRKGLVADATAWPYLYAASESNRCPVRSG